MLGIDTRLIHHTTKKWIIVGILAGLTEVGLLLVLYWLLGQSLDGVLNGQNFLSQIVGWVIVLLLGKAFFAWLYRTSQAKASSETKVSVRDMVYRHALKLGPGLLGKKRTGELVNTAVDGMDWLEDYYGVYFIQFAVGMTTPIFLCIFILGIDWVVGLSLILAIPLTPIFIGAVAKSFKNVSKRYASVLDTQSAQFLDSLQGMATLKSFNLSKKRGEEMRIANEELRQETMGLLFVNQMMIAIVDFGFALCSTMVITIVALIRLDGGFLTAGEVVALILVSSQFSRTLAALGKFFFAGAVGREIANKIGRFLDQKPSIQDSTANENTPIKLERPEIEFENVSFSYDGSNSPAINDLNLKINAGETLALIGHSGCGKTTVTNLILRTLQPSAGTIKFDGTNVDDLPVEWMRSQIALVPQDPYLFFGTIRENLLVAKSDATDEELKAATQAAEIYDYIMSTPKGFDTLSGEQGQVLSGGQVQRLAIARAFLKDAPIVILDEPTSQIDVETEAQLTKALKRLTADKTVLLIAHRLSTVEQADRIVVLSEGKVVEQGTRDELLRIDGAYARMVKTKRSTEIHGFAGEEVA